MPEKSLSEISSETYFIGCAIKDYSFTLNLCDSIGFKVEYLESPTAKAIWQSAELLFSKGVSVDIASLVEHIDAEVGHINVDAASSYMMKAMSLVTEHHNLTHHISIIKHKYRRRNAADVFELAIKRLIDNEDVEDVTSLVMHNLAKIKSELNHSSESKADKRERIKERYTNVRNKGASGILSRYTQLQQHLTSYRYGKVTVLAARPKMGKSTLALNEAVFTAYTNRIPTAIFSIEMDYDELIEKAASDLTEMDNKKLNLGEYSTEQIDKFMTNGVDEAMSAPLYVIDDPSITVERICSKTRELVAEHGVKLVIVDYLQIISSTPGSRFQSRTYEIGHMTNELRKLAKDTGVALILLSQITRPPKGNGYETDPKKMPMPTMNDMRDSGSIEQDAYAIIIIGPTQCGSTSPPSWQFIEPCCVRVEANRGGSTGDFECMFNKPNNKFMTYLDYENYRQTYFAKQTAQQKKSTP
jgi:replicative DNA helicase